MFFGLALAASVNVVSSKAAVKPETNVWNNPFACYSHSYTTSNMMLENDLACRGISFFDIHRVLSDHRLSYEKKVGRYIRKNPENQLTYGQYRDMLISEYRIKKGREFIRENEELLFEVQGETGVSMHDISAILGIESGYGNKRLQGRFIVFNALYSRYVDFPESREWMAREMAYLIRFANENDIDVFEVTGSYGGAIGIAQFIPSSLWSLFVDGNKDGKRDPFDLEDAVHSIANYLLDNGYEYNNKDARYNAIFAYNHSHLYVLAILELSDLL